MNEHHWIRVTAIDNVPPREGREVTVGGRHLAIFNLGDRVFATDNRCPHKGGPLCDGIITGGAVVCPLHAWKVDLATGTVQRPVGNESCIATYPTRVEDGVIMVGVPAVEAECKEDAA